MGKVSPKPVTAKTRPPSVSNRPSSVRRVPAFVSIIVGSMANRDGLGARVTVYAGGRALTQQMDGKSGYLAQSSLPLWFGLGSAETVERVEVLWPSGRRQTVTEGLAPGKRVEIVEEVADAAPAG